MGIHLVFWILGVGLTLSLSLSSQASWAQQLGKVVGAEGKPQQISPQQPDWELLRWGDEIFAKHALKTEKASTSRASVKAEVLLLRGHKFVLAEDAQVSIEERLSPQGSRVELVLKVGTVRVVTANSPGSILVTRTSTAIATPQRTGYIVSCGPPTTPTPDVCLFVGLYGETDVEARAAPRRSVRLQRQQFTYVAVNQQPDPDPPQLLSTTDFATLLNETTVVGTGAPEDRLDLANSSNTLQHDSLTVTIPQTPPIRGFLPTVIIDQPLPQFDPRLGGVPLGQQPLPEPPALP